MRNLLRTTAVIEKEGDEGNPDPAKWARSSSLSKPAQPLEGNLDFTGAGIHAHTSIGQSGVRGRSNRIGASRCLRGPDGPLAGLQPSLQAPRKRLSQPVR